MVVKKNAKRLFGRHKDRSDKPSSNKREFESSSGGAKLPEGIEREIRIVVIGNSESGKTSLIRRYVENTFDSSLPPQVEAVATHLHLVNMNNRALQLRIWDTTERIWEEGAVVPKYESYFKRAEGVIFVYDVSDRKSFLDLRTMLRKALSLARDGNEQTVLIAGSKIDLSDGAKQVVTYAEAERFCKLFNFPNCEFSAKNAIGVDEMFHNLVNSILERLPVAAPADQASPSMRKSRTSKTGNSRSRRGTHTSKHISLADTISKRSSSTKKNDENTYDPEGESKEELAAAERAKRKVERNREKRRTNVLFAPLPDGTFLPFVRRSRSGYSERGEETAATNFRGNSKLVKILGASDNGMGILPSSQSFQGPPSMMAGKFNTLPTEFQRSQTVAGAILRKSRIATSFGPSSRAAFLSRSSEPSSMTNMTLDSSNNVVAEEETKKEGGTEEGTRKHRSKHKSRSSRKGKKEDRSSSSKSRRRKSRSTRAQTLPGEGNNNPSTFHQTPSLTKKEKANQANAQVGSSPNEFKSADDVNDAHIAYSQAMEVEEPEANKKSTDEEGVAYSFAEATDEKDTLSNQDEASSISKKLDSESLTDLPSDDGEDPASTLDEEVVDSAVAYSFADPAVPATIGPSDEESSVDEVDSEEIDAGVVYSGAVGPPTLSSSGAHEPSDKDVGLLSDSGAEDAGVAYRVADAGVDENSQKGEDSSSLEKSLSDQVGSDSDDLEGVSYNFATEDGENSGPPSASDYQIYAPSISDKEEEKEYLSLAESKATLQAVARPPSATSTRLRRLKEARERQKISGVGSNTLSGVQRSNDDQGRVRGLGDDAEMQAKQLALQDNPQSPADFGNWNERFQFIVSQYREKNWLDMSEKEDQVINTALLHLTQDFINTAKIYGRIIIAERYMDSKTILPVNMGGHAGGDKYIVNSILFKFAVDNNNLYGGDYAAAKVAAQELKGLNSYFSCGIAKLHVPLMALVDFMGLRLIAMSLLPIGKNSLVVGSDDAARTVHADDEEAMKLMSMAAKRLNLKSHLCGRRNPVLLHSACDVEVHRGTDRRLYVLDFSRTLPPTTPNPKLHNGHLFNMFRHEFVTKYRVPLCPDAYSGFIMKDPDAGIHNKEIRDATNYLLEKIVPAATNSLHRALDQSVGRIETVQVSEHFHKLGLNIRYIGSCLEKTRSRDVALLLLSEAAARVLRNDLRLQLREKMKSLKMPLMAPFHKLVVDFFNKVFGNYPSEKQSRDYWENVVKARMSLYYHVPEKYLLPKRDGASHQSMMASYQQRELFHMKSILGEKIRGTPVYEHLLAQLQRITFISLRSDASSRYKLSMIYDKVDESATDHDCVFDVMDIKKMKVHVKHTSLATAAEANFYFMKAYALVRKYKEALHAAEKNKTRNDADQNQQSIVAVVSRQEVVKLLDQAQKKFTEVLTSNPNHKEALLNLAEVRCTLLRIAPEDEDDPHARLQLGHTDTFTMANQQVLEIDAYYRRALEDSPDAHALFHYGKFLQRCGLFERADERYLQCLEMDPDHLRCLKAYGKLLYLQNEQLLAHRFHLRRAAILRGNSVVNHA